MTVLSHAATSAPSKRHLVPWPQLICVAAAAATVPVFLLTSLTGDTGAEIAAGLVDDAVALGVGSILAVLVSAALVLAAVRLGRSVPGDAGTVLLAAGCAVALMYAGYYAVFGAGGVVASQMLDEPGPGLGEATSLLLNIMEITRYAPGLALVAAAVAARRHLSRWIHVTAAVLLVLTLVPLTSWAAALLAPMWLALAGAAVGTTPRHAR